MEALTLLHERSSMGKLAGPAPSREQLDALYHAALRAPDHKELMPWRFIEFSGAGLDSVIAAQEAADPGCAAAGTCSIELSALITRDIVLAFAALGLAALIPVVVKKWRKRKLPPA